MPVAGEQVCWFESRNFAPMDGGSPPQEPSAEGLSMEERVVHKNWKIRKEAYEELGRSFESELDANAEIFSTFGEFIPDQP